MGSASDDEQINTEQVFLARDIALIKLQDKNVMDILGHLWMVTK